MKYIVKKFLSISICIIFVLSQLSVVYAMDTTEAPNADDIVITNNAGLADTIVVSNLYGGETIKVYNAASSGKMIGSATVSTTKTEATLKITQLGMKAGAVYITLMAKGEMESNRTKAGYEAEAQSDPLSVDNIIVANNAGKPDIVSVSNLYGGEVIKVYKDETSGRLLGSATAGSTKTEANVTITQVGSDGGSVYVSITSKGKLESERVKVEFSAEEKSITPDIGSITITNNAGIADIIKVNNLSTGDVVRIYNAAKGGTLLGYASVSYGSTDIKISISQLGKAEGSAYVAIISKGLLESDRIKVEYSAEAIATSVTAANVTVTNNSGSNDTVKVTCLSSGDIIKVYDAVSGGNQIGTGTVNSSSSEVTITISQLGTTAGSIYITSRSMGKYESGRVKIDFAAEENTNPLNTDNVIIVNNAGKSDTVKVLSLTAADIVKIYDSATGGNLIGSATVSSSTAEVTVMISQLGKSSGSVYISVTGKGKTESVRKEVSYLSEPVSDTIDSYNITVVNNPAGKSDTVTVANLTAGDIVKVYDSAGSGTVLGSASSSKTEVTISITQLGKSGGYVYVSVTGTYKNESERIKVEYSAETETDSISGDSITVTNNVVGTVDTVEVTDLAGGDLVKVYSAVAGGKLLGSATVADNSSYVTVSITQLGTSAGSVYVSITGISKLESSRAKADYEAESSSTAIKSDNIAVSNNAGASDTVEVTGLTEKDIIKIYNAAKGGTLLGSATVAPYGTYVTVTISQLGISAGSVYVSVASTNKTESGRTKADYSAEPQSGSASTDNIIVANNAGVSDTVQVTGLTTNDLVKVYDAAKGGNLLGSATVSSGTTVTVTISQLGTSGGSIYVSITGGNKLEGDRTTVEYSSESQSAAPSASNVSVTNNVSISDIIVVSGLTDGDAVTVYDSQKAGTQLGKATAGTYETSVSISIIQLGSDAGSIYITVTSKNKLESNRTKADYSAESSTSSLKSDDITVTNNAGSSDTVQVSDIGMNDTIKVYDSSTGGNLLGSATVSSGMSVMLSIEQLGTSAGKIYISVTGSKKLESSRTEVSYSAEGKSSAPEADNITITNNVGTTDTVKVSGISAGDIIKVYDSAKSGTLLGTVTANTYDSSVTATITQLGSIAGSVYISAAIKNKLESDRTQADYAAEAQTSAPSEGDITVVNNAGLADTVRVENLSGDETINIYNAAKSGNLLGTVTAGTYDSSVNISITQLGATAGSIYVTLTAKSTLESSRVRVSYTAEPKTAVLSVSNIEIANNAGISDTVTVTGLSGSETIRVYDSAAGGSLLGSESASIYDSSATVTIDQLGTSSGGAYVTVAKKGYSESPRVRVDYVEEPKSTASDISNVVIQNNAGAADTVQVNGLSGGDTVYVYNKATTGTLLGSATVGTNDTYVMVTISQLSAAAGSIYISTKSTGKLESSRIEASFAAEQTTDAPQAGNIAITNNAGMADTIEMVYLEAGDYVRVYKAALSGTLLGSGTVASDETEVTIKITQLGSSSGTVYISVTSKNKLESKRTAVFYTEEPTSETPESSNIVVVNNVKISDTVTVYFLEEDDTINVYNASSGGKLLGSATIEEDETQGTASISQLGTTAGNIYVSVAGLGKKESDRVKVGYNAEQQSDPLSSSNVYVTNNTSMSDTVTVRYLDESDVIKVYATSTGTTVLGTATVASGCSDVTIKISQIGAGSGNIYVTITGYGKRESERISVYYPAEPTSDAPEAANITVTNNRGKSDTVYVSGLIEGDIVKVYNVASNGSLLGNATVAEDYASVTIKITQLGTTAGTIFISVTSTGAYESDRTAISYSAE
jgi:hypothetical protein